MRFVVFGAGAIGTYLGGSLVGAGHEAIFIDTPSTAARLRQKGLALENRGRTITLPPSGFVSSWPEASRLGSYDTGIFALKSYDTQDAIEQLSPYLRELPPLICVQNGVDNEPALAAALGETRVIDGTVTSAIGRPSPDRIVVTKSRGVGLASNHALSQQLAAAFAAAGLSPRLYINAPAMKWSKLMTNLMANATSAILDMLPEEIFRDARLFGVELEMLRECLHVMRAMRLPVVDLPRTPVRALAFAVEHLPFTVAQAVLSRVVGGGRGGKMPSFFLDLQSARGRTEVNWLNGAVVRAGARVGISTPVNSVLTVTLTQLAEDGRRREEYRREPEALLAAIAAGRYPAAAR
jgi:2-dehydropantoate 2-reductase